MNPHVQMVYITDLCDGIADHVKVPMRWESLSNDETTQIDIIHKLLLEARAHANDLRWSRS